MGLLLELGFGLGAFVLMMIFRCQAGMGLEEFLLPLAQAVLVGFFTAIGARLSRLTMREIGRRVSNIPKGPS